MNASGSFEYQLIGIATVISRDLFTVPVNQRSYSWTTKEVQEFIDDISIAINSSSTFYYLGPIVLRKVPNVDTVQVVDGQQRLVTAVIAITAIRDSIFEAGDEARAQKLTAKYLSEEETWTDVPIPRITLNQLDHDFFVGRVLPLPGRDDPYAVPATKRSHERLLAAYWLLKRFFGKLLKASGQDKLREWSEFLSRSAQVLVCRFDENTNPFTLFETLNARGLQPSTSELVKNYLFGLAEQRLDACMPSWGEMVGALEAVDAINKEDIVDVYLRHYWISKTGRIARTSAIFGEVRTQITTTSEAMKFVADLAGAAKKYHCLINPSPQTWQPYDSDSCSWMDAINCMGMIQIRPLVLAVLTKFPKKEIRWSMKYLVSGSMRLLISKAAGTGNIEFAFATVVGKIIAGEIKSSSDLRRALKGFVPSDADFESAFGSYTLAKKPLIRYILRSLESAAKGSSDPAFIVNPSKDIVNTEHILPVTFVETEWPEFSQDQHRAYVRRIGNLTLMMSKVNSRVGNRGFAAKKPFLLAEEFLLTKKVPSYAQWSPGAVEHRQEQLAKLAIKAWPL